MDTLRGPEIDFLARLLATVESIFAPVRLNDANRQSAAAIHERVRRYQRGLGVPLAVSGNAADRQSARRTLMSLQRRGLVALVGRGRNRGVELTDAGDSYSRSICPATRLDESWPLLLCVLQVQCESATVGHVIENDVAACYAAAAGDYFPLQVVEDHAMPLLVGGFLDCWSDGRGRLGYRITDRGADLLRGDRPAPPKRPPAYDTQVGAMFAKIFHGLMEERETWQPSGATTIVALSCGSWPVWRKKRGRRRRA